MKCGHCKEDHPTLQEVKDCAALGTAPTATSFAAALAETKAEPLITERQLSYLTLLVQERPAWADVMNYHVDRLPTFTKAMAHQAISEALEVPKETTSTNGNGGAIATDVPFGHYAVPSASGNNDLDFYVVKQGKGRHEGRVFVDRVVGGHPDYGLRKAQAEAALEQIKQAGIEEARKRYADELGRCYRCNRHLTDELSRSRGIGPECYKLEAA